MQQTASDRPSALAASPAPAISLTDVGLTFGDAVIFEHLSFDVRPGEFLCLLGPSGCGKSTTLRLIGDLLTQQSGTVRVGGLPPEQTWDRLAYVFQNPRLLPWKNALDNAAFGLEMRRPQMPAAERRAIATRQLARVGLAADAQKMPNMLSGGERQRVSIARALALDPAIILMDEPFSALDPNTRQRLRQELVDLWRVSGKTVVFVTHDIDEAVFLADRIVILSRKPSSVRAVVTVDAPRPRDLEASAELRQVRGELAAIFNDMGVMPEAEEEHA